MLTRPSESCSPWVPLVPPVNVRRAFESSLIPSVTRSASSSAVTAQADSWHGGCFVFRSWRALSVVKITHEPPGYVCPFCRLASGGEDARNTQRDVVRRSAGVIAFISPRWWPNNHGHVLVVPTGHYENLYDLPAARRPVSPGTIARWSAPPPGMLSSPAGGRHSGGAAPENTTSLPIYCCCYSSRGPTTSFAPADASGRRPLRAARGEPPVSRPLRSFARCGRPEAAAASCPGRRRAARRTESPWRRPPQPSAGRHRLASVSQQELGSRAYYRR
jgi:hypothetical protein